MTIWGGIFPIVVNWWAALGLTVYYVATNNVLFYVRNVQHVQALWFANTANSILWWTYVKACMRAVMTLVGASSITFKTTLKVGGCWLDCFWSSPFGGGLCLCLWPAHLDQTLSCGACADRTLGLSYQECSSPPVQCS